MLRNIPSAMLRKLLLLSERKEALMARVQNIEQKMVRLQRHAESRNNRPTQLTVTRPGVRKAGRRQTGRGELKEKIGAARSR